MEMNLGRPGAKLDRLAADELLEVDQQELSFADGKNVPEALYAAAVPLSRRKRYGQFFTPEAVAVLMAEWVARISPKLVIDPAVGTGVFLRALAAHIDSNCRIDCYDIDPLITSYIISEESGISPQKSVHISDYLTADISKIYDAAIMNPPYLRHHDMCYSFDIHNYVSGLTQHKVSKLANAYVLFVMKTCEILRDGGRAAFIIPTEWTNANFGQPFKEYLIDKGGLRHLIYFSNCSDVFPDALTTSCILLIEKSPTANKSVDVTYIEGAKPPFSYQSLDALNKVYPARKIDVDVLRNATKWDHIIRNRNIVELPGFTRLGNLGTSKRGVATGANDFFHISSTAAKEIGIASRHLIPCIGRANDVSGFVFGSEDYDYLLHNGKRSQLVVFDSELTDAEFEYISSGEARGLDKRYLLSKRRPWYSMETYRPAPIWAAVFGRSGLRFIHNQAMIANLTTFHGFYPHDTTSHHVRALTVVLNSRIVQKASHAHIRVYGGGLLKFEPNDLLDIQVPNIAVVSHTTLLALADCLDEQQGRSLDWEKVDRLVNQAAEEAANSDLESSSTVPPMGRTKAS
jgi:adenine-specific DNA-methyltransferase